MIKFVRLYKSHCETVEFVDVIYYSFRCYTYKVEDMPETVKKYIAEADKITEEYNPIFKRKETIYEHTESE